MRPSPQIADNKDGIAAKRRKKRKRKDEEKISLKAAKVTANARE